MENITAMIVISAVIFLSKNRFIPITILAYYAAYSLVQCLFVGGITDVLPFIGKTFSIGSAYHASIMSIELLIIIALCCNTNKYFMIGTIYAVAVFTSMIFNAIQTVSMTIESNWFVNFYTIRQQIAIPLDILAAIMGSDNFVSRKLNNFWRDNINAHSRGTTNQHTNGSK